MEILAHFLCFKANLQLRLGFPLSHLVLCTHTPASLTLLENSLIFTFIHKFCSLFCFFPSSSFFFIYIFLHMIYCFEMLVVFDFAGQNRADTRGTERVLWNQLTAHVWSQLILILAFSLYWKCALFFILLILFPLTLSLSLSLSPILAVVFVHSLFYKQLFYIVTLSSVRSIILIRDWTHLFFLKLLI